MDFDELQDYLVAVTVATEIPPARTDEAGPEVEIEAVIDVVRNRARLWGQSPAEVVLARRQFSGVCQEYWKRALAGQWFPAHVGRCYALWLDRFRFNVPDITHGCTHYYSPIGMKPPGRVPRFAQLGTEVVIPGVRRTHFRFFTDVT